MIKVGMSPPSHEAVKLIESAVHGMTRHIESKVPFPVSTRDVSRFSHEHGNPFFIQRHPAATLTRCVDSEALLIATRHEPGASRRTDMTTRVAIGADYPISRKRIDMRGADFRRGVRIVADIGVALIVGDNHNNIGPVSCSRSESE